MDDPVPNRSLADVTSLRIVDHELAIWPVFVGLLFEISAQSKDISLQAIFKTHDIELLAFALLEFIPSLKQIARIDYLFE